MITYEKISDKPRAFNSLVGMNIQEFDQLLPQFKKAFDEDAYKSFVEGKKRQRSFGGGRKGILRSYESKLLFILIYFKIYPLQEVMGFLFGMGQSQANEWIHRLTRVLNSALGYEMHLPERQAQNLEQVLSSCPGLEFMIDGTERRIQRPKDKDKQKTFYSGKKKAHTKKNNVIIDSNTKRVKFLSGTHEGKKHDKKICDEEEYKFPKKSTLYQDTGFQGYEPENVTTLQPMKKPKGRELSEEEKQRNKKISSVRIRVEHVIGSIKICRIVKDIFRNYKENYSDLAMQIACGLHNYRLSCRTA